MSKLVSFLSFLIFIISFYYFFDNNNSEFSSSELPALKRVGNIYSETEMPTLKRAGNIYSEIELPVAAKAREIKILKDDVTWKMKKTPYSYADDIKTTTPRLTKEEIAKAPVVDVIEMNYNGEDMELVVVEKDGKTFDASDGVRVYIPKNYGKIFRENREKARRGGR